ncbi:33635_t:CDS:2 [Gigaspora margarita]|uniref:33635_t:CDS:1 n=1 Tax=Gigaspora margarita TaxID=4874 RepID=A0ABN7UYP2_GIGMA|nr:33635_t:CDS:2 [Gigaspora margarita]
MVRLTQGHYNAKTLAERRKAKIEIESDKIYPKAASSQKVPQINVLLQEILKRLEIVENN